MHHDDLQQVSFQLLLGAENWQTQYRLITDWGKLIHAKPALHQPQYLIQGCEMPAWLTHHIINERYVFVFDSHSRVMNGLVAIILSLVNNKTSLELRTLNITALLATVGLEKHLTPSRNNGLQKIIARIEAVAESC